MLPMIRGTVCRNLERRSGRIAAGCAKVNGITWRRLADIAGDSQVFRPDEPKGPSGRLVQPSSIRAGVVLLAIHAGALVVLRPLDTTLLSCANMTVGRHIGLLAIDMGLAALQ